MFQRNFSVFSTTFVKIVTKINIPNISLKNYTNLVSYCHLKINIGNFKKIATVYKIILKNSHSFKKFKN